LMLVINLLYISDYYIMKLLKILYLSIY